MNAPADTEALQRCLRDVFGLLALPGLWGGRDAERIVETLLEALEAILPLEFAFASVRFRPRHPPLELLRSRGARADPGAPPWREALAACAARDTTPGTGTIRVGARAGVRFSRLPIGYYAAHGVLVTAAARDDYPGPTEGAVLNAALALAATGLHTARAIEEREAALRLKDEFLAMLGHELRNPVAAISAAASVLGRPDIGAGTGALAHQVLLRQTRQLTRLLDDLLDVSRADSGHLRLERLPVDLGDVVARTVAVARAASPSPHEFTVATEPVVVLGDAARIEQIVMNLLTNAIRYTPAGGQIQVTVHGDTDAGVLRVQDSGIGIEPDLLPRVFDTFVRGRLSGGEHAPGLGIGLALVRKLVELHDGAVEALSEGPGRGSAFVVRLPRAAAPGAVETPPRQLGQHARRRVLVIEDHDDNREMLGTLLRLGGHDAYGASDGRSGVRLACESQPDIALVDIGLPDIDGYEVARLIREALGSRIRLVALTGFGQPEDRARALTAGFDAHLVKPVTPEGLDAVMVGAPAS